jgi:hypothetical protein
MRDLNELGIRWIGAPAPRLPSDKEVRRFEQYFKAELPLDYVTFLKTVNGGYPRLRRFELPDGSAYSLNNFYSLGSESRLPSEVAEKWEYGNLWAETRVRRMDIGDSIIPIGRDNIGDQIVLDFSRQPPSVGIALHEQRFEIATIAASFSDFLEQLH